MCRLHLTSAESPANQEDLADSQTPVKFLTNQLILWRFDWSADFWRFQSYKLTPVDLADQLTPGDPRLQISWPQVDLADQLTPGEFGWSADSRRIWLISWLQVDLADQLTPCRSVWTADSRLIRLISLLQVDLTDKLTSSQTKMTPRLNCFNSTLESSKQDLSNSFFELPTSLVQSRFFFASVVTRFLKATVLTNKRQKLFLDQLCQL